MEIHTKIHRQIHSFQITGGKRFPQGYPHGNPRASPLHPAGAGTWSAEAGSRQETGQGLAGSWPETGQELGGHWLDTGRRLAGSWRRLGWVLAGSWPELGWWLTGRPLETIINPWMIKHASSDTHPASSIEHQSLSLIDYRSVSCRLLIDYSSVSNRLSNDY